MMSPLRRKLLLLPLLAACVPGGGTLEETGLPVIIGETGETAHTGHSADSRDSAHTGEPTHTGDSAHSGETGKPLETGDTGKPLPADDSAETGDTGDTGEVILPSDTITLYALRHAEKEEDGDDPGLTEEGQARAEALAVLMTDVPLTAVYATELQRTQLTVTPTAEDHGLDIQTDLDPEEELAMHIIATHGGETVIHCGHSYTLPDFFEALALDPEPDVSGYGQLWIITLEADGSTSWEETTFGE